MQAFHNDEKVQQKYLARVRAHALADEIVKRQYWEDGKGCAVGCTIHSSEHNAYETELGIPEWLARLEDTIFESVSNERAKKWPFEFLDAVNIGSDLEKIKTPFLIFILKQNLKYLDEVKFDAEVFPQVREAIIGSQKAVAEMIRCHEEGLDLSAAESAESAAWSAESAARSAESAARSARSAARSARSAAFETYADKLLELIRECR